MLINADDMRKLVFLCTIAMSLLAVLSLHIRKMSLEAYLGWGTLAIQRPILGLFLFIWTTPGDPSAV